MHVYRLCRPLHAELDGEGARLHGGRWNARGVPVVYTSASRALAFLETLVHGGLEFLPRDLALLTIDVPDDSTVEEVAPRRLPRDWDAYPAPLALAAIGADWIARGAALALRVPSAVVHEEHTVLLNPRHAGMRHVRIVRRGAFQPDVRFFGGTP